MRIVKRKNLDKTLVKVIGYVRNMLRRIQENIERERKLVLEQLY